MPEKEEKKKMRFYERDSFWGAAATVTVGLFTLIGTVICNRSKMKMLQEIRSDEKNNIIYNGIEDSFIKKNI